MKTQIVILGLAGAFLILSSPVVATERLVPSQYSTIQAAIDDCNNGDVVIAEPNIYTGPGNRDIDFKGLAITVRGTDPNDPNVVAATVIDCENSGRGFNFHSGETSGSQVAGLTITNGDVGSGRGGGICCGTGSSPTITYCKISNNSAYLGGGIYCESSSPMISRCTIVNNVADPPSGPQSMTEGGGICSFGGSPTISHCTITGNRGTGRLSKGGGIYLGGTSAIVTNCTITGNWVNVSGTTRGGGIYCECGIPTIRQCTIADNQAGWSGGGFSCDCYPNNATISGCILWGNSAYNGQQIGDFAPQVLYSDVEGGYSGEGNIDVDPLFVDAAAGDYHLSAFSLCIDSGDPCYSSAPGETDIDGDPRVMMDGVDIGADEFLPQTPFISIVPIELDFFSYFGGPNPEPQALSIRNKGIGTLNWQITEDCDWLLAEPNSGSSTGGGADDVNLSVDISGLVAGAYTCNLTISDANAQNSPQVVTVNLDIYPFEDALYVPAEYPTIQAAIDAANDLDTVIVAPGTYTGADNKNLDFGGKAITVRGFDPEDPCVVAETVIDCQSSGRGFYFHNGEEANSVLAGFTIKRGKVTGRPAKGGAIYCSGASPTIKNCVITSNQALGSGGDPHGENAYGGGVYCESNSYLTLTDCTVSSNGATGGRGDDLWCSPSSGCSGGWGNGGGGYGGGIYSSSDSSLTILGCIISDNSASGGSGGVYYETGTPMGEANAGRALGGGVCGQLTMNNCTIQRNEALRGRGDMPFMESGGGGIYSIGISSVENCLILYNHIKDYYGSAVYHRNDGMCLIANCTVSGNTSDDPIVYAVSVSGGAEVVINDSIIWGHGGRDVSSACSVTYSCLEQNVVGTGNVHSDPCFVAGPLGDYYLSQIVAGQAFDSPCVDAGSDTAANLGMDMYTTRTDEVGDKGIVDMGYHHAISPGSPDIDEDGDVDFFDYAWFAMSWPYRTSHQIPRGSVLVDGDLSDWPEGVEWRELDKVYWGNPNDVTEAKLALQWDDATDKVYAAVVVNDTNHLFLDEFVYWDASDRIEVYSQGDVEGGTGWNGVYDVAQQYYVAPDTIGGSWARWSYGWTLGEDAGLEYAVGVEGTEIIYEVGVRMFDNYGNFSGGETLLTDLHAGHVVGFDIVVCTRWDTVNFGMLSENLMTGKFNDAGKFAKYMLVDEIFSIDLDGNGVIDYGDVRVLADNWLWKKQQ